MPRPKRGAKENTIPETTNQPEMGSSRPEPTSQSTDESSAVDNCRRCQLRKFNPRFKHVKCNEHMDCYSKTEWVPENCEVCISLQDGFRNQGMSRNPEMCNELRKMLLSMSTYAAGAEDCHQWAYVNKASTFMGVTLKDIDGDNSENSEFLGFTKQQTRRVKKSKTRPHDATHTSGEGSRSNSSAYSSFPVDIEGDLNGWLKEQVALKVDLYLKDKLDSERVSKRMSRKDVYDQFQSPRHVKRQKRIDSSSEESDRSDMDISDSDDSDQDSDLDQQGNQKLICNIDSQNVTWFKLKQKGVTRLDDGRIIMNGKTHSIVLNHEGDQFKIHDSSATPSPYVSRPQAQEILMKSLGYTVVVSDNPGQGRKAVRVNLTETSGTSKLMKVVAEGVDDIIADLEKDQPNPFPNVLKDEMFKPVMTALFESGWKLAETSFQDWAKWTPLDMDKAARDLNIKWSPAVPLWFINEEKFCRHKLINMITLYCLYDAKIELIKRRREMSSLSRQWQHIALVH